MEKFSKVKAIVFGWEAMKKSFWFFCGLLIIVSLVQVIPNVLCNLYGEKSPLVSTAFGIISFIASTIIAIGLIKISLKLYDNTDSPRLSGLFAVRGVFLKYLFASLLYSLAVFVGLLLLIVPGIIMWVRCQFFGYLIVDKKLGPIKALKESFAMTRGNGGNLFLLGILLTVIFLLGILALLVGLFAAFPITIMAEVFVYRFLVERSGSLAAAPAV
ncbi:MAG: hypothetical protein WC576_03945 [Candidatus Omnitrophota bacterium]